MGKADTVTKDYLRCSDVFADVFNQFLYDGQQKTTPEWLMELDTAEIAVPYGADNAVAHQAVDVINAVTNSMVRYPEREEAVDMCLAIQEIREEGKLEGEKRGEIIGVIRATKSGTFH